MTRTWRTIGAIAIAAVLAILFVAVVDLGVLRVIGDPKGPGHLGSMRFPGALSEPSAGSHNGFGPPAGVGTVWGPAEDPGDD